jgi:AraC-like DNA-binding protein
VAKHKATAADTKTGRLECGLFSDHVRRFKEKESPESVLLVADEPEFTKIIVAWTSLDLRQADDPTDLAGQSEREIWDWLWTNTRYSLDDLAERSGLTSSLVERKLKPLIGNRVLYPDGTVNSFVQRYLRERVLKLFETRPKRPPKRT